MRGATLQIVKLLRFEMLEVPFIMRYRKGLLERGHIDGQQVWDVLEKVCFAPRYPAQHGILTQLLFGTGWHPNRHGPPAVTVSHSGRVSHPARYPRRHDTG